MASLYVGAFALVITLSACASSDPESCGVAGTTQTCVCGGASVGGQRCEASGTWSLCDCAEPAQDTSVADTAGEADVGADTATSDATLTDTVSVEDTVNVEDAATDSGDTSDTHADANEPPACVVTAPLHGVVDGGQGPSSLAAGAAATYTCDEGYTLTGAAPTCVLTDNAAALDGDEPTCVPSDIDFTIKINDLGIPDDIWTCYDIEVHDATGARVSAHGDPTTVSPDQFTAEEEGSICTPFGAPTDGTIALTEACSPLGGTHTVTVHIDNAFRNWNSPHDNWANPCPVGGPGCKRTFACTPEAAPTVSFDLLPVTKSSSVADPKVLLVDEFECALRLNTCYSDGTPIELLIPPGGSNRVKTAVLGFACRHTTNGQSQPMLFANDMSLVCAGVTYPIPVNGAQGNRTPPAGGGVAALAAYFGTEDLGSQRQIYWNHAIAMNPGAAARNCSLRARLSIGYVAGPRLPFDTSASGWTTPTGAVYPTFEVDAKLTDGTGWFDADANATNGNCQNTEIFNATVGSRVGATFSTTTEPSHFCVRFDGTATSDSCQ